ncbi:hypothetical protein FRC12_002773 [Ceratobasidium sp. 428]|nr:hypothetical protein FRC12_002773 [Ceratobasidium sp. 428]
MDTLATSHLRRFELTCEMIDLEEALAVQNQAATLVPKGHLFEPEVLATLGTLYRNRFEQLGDPNDLDLAIQKHELAQSLMPEKH